MRVVLRQDVDNLGLRGEVVTVARGYARNFLLPRGLAEAATPGLVAELARREVRQARHQARNTEEAQAIVGRLEGIELRFDVKAGPGGSLFGSVTATSVADALWETHKVRIDRRKLELTPIKRIGRYTAPVEVFAGVTAELHLLVVPEGGELPPDEELAPETVDEAGESAGSVSGEVAGGTASGEQDAPEASEPDVAPTGAGAPEADDSESDPAG